MYVFTSASVYKLKLFRFNRNVNCMNVPLLFKRLKKTLKECLENIEINVQ